MTARNTVLRSMHDLGAAAWFGGALMGAVGVNGAAAEAADATERPRLSAAGWAKWAPVNAVAIGAHLVGGTGILLANRGRARHQAGVTANSAVKLVLTGAALGATAWSGTLGATIAEHGNVPARGATEPSAQTPPAVAKAQQQLQQLQWALPVLTGAIIVLTAQQGEQQRPTQILTGVATKLAARA